MSLVFGKKINTGNIFRDSDLTTVFKSSSVEFDVCDNTGITVSKSVDRSDKAYFSGDPITFTIIINNASGAQLNDLVFRDEIDPNIVPASGTEYDVTTTIGTIDSKVNPIQISGITIPTGSQCTITISGVVASE